MTAPGSGGDALAGFLRRGAAIGGPGAASTAQARTFGAAIEAGVPLPEAWARAGLDPRLVAAVAPAADPATAARGALAVVEAAEPHTQALRAAAAYPLVVAVLAVSAGLLVFGVAGPALALLPFEGGEGASSWAGGAGAALGVASAALVAIATLVIGRAPLPSWRRLDALVYWGVVSAAVAHGAGLPAAIRAAAPWLRGRAAAAEQLAAALEAGRGPDAIPGVLDAYEAGLLWAGAGAGFAGEALAALVAHRRHALDREIPMAVARIHVMGLALGAVAVLAVGAALMRGYAVGVGG